MKPVHVRAPPGLNERIALWAATIDGKAIGLSWQWDVGPLSSVALSDPMSISTNAVIVDEQGGLLSADSRIIALNGFVYQLGWQEHVVRASRLQLVKGNRMV